MTVSLLLGLAGLLAYTSAQGGEFILNQGTWGRQEQCKELIVQHVLTFGKSPFDPEVVRNCIAFLRSGNSEHLRGTISESYNKQVKTLNLPVSGKVLITLDERLKKSIVTGKNVEKNSYLTISSEISKTLSPKDDKFINIHPENIVQEGPAVEMTRKKRSNGNQGSTKNNEAYVTEGRPEWELHTPQDDEELDQRSRPGVYGNQRTTARVKARTKKVTDPVVLSQKPNTEQHTLKDDLQLDERSRNRPQTRIQLLIFYFKRFNNWLRNALGLGPKVIQA